MKSRPECLGDSENSVLEESLLPLNLSCPHSDRCIPESLEARRTEGVGPEKWLDFTLHVGGALNSGQSWPQNDYASVTLDSGKDINVKTWKSHLQTT